MPVLSVPHRLVPTPEPSQQAFKGFSRGDHGFPTPYHSHQGSSSQEATRPVKDKEIKKSNSFLSRWRKPKEHKQRSHSGPDWIDLAGVEEQGNPEKMKAHNQTRKDAIEVSQPSKQGITKDAVKEKTPKRRSFWKRTKKDKIVSC